MYKQVFKRVRDIPTDLIQRLNENERRSVREKEKRSIKREREFQQEIMREIAEMERADEERRMKKNEKARERRAQKKKEKEKMLRVKVISWDKLPEWIEKNVGDKSKPFRLRLRSANSEASAIFNFRDQNHFINWHDAIERQTVQQDSANYTAYVEINGDRDVFAMIIPELLPVDGGCNYHGKEHITKETPFYKLSLYNPITGGNNNCAFKILERLSEKKLNYGELRKQYGLGTGDRIPTDVFNKIYRTLGLSKVLIFIDETFGDEMNKNYEYIFMADNHYYHVEGAEYKTYKDKHTKRGMLYWDIETRPTERYVTVGNTKSYILKDTILCAYYKRYKGEYESITFRTGSTSSCRQFLDWLTKEANEGHYYNCIAHNGSRFDVYFLISYLSQQEQLHTETQLRGYSIIGMQYKSHLFKDSCCFLTASLDSLCRAFKVKQAKLTEFEYNGQKLTNKNMCFYKPELGFDEFMALQEKEPEYWKLYEEYCLFDCIGLMNVWSSFKEQYDALMDTVFKYKPELKRFVDLMGTNTIGSLSKKILENTCKEKFGDKGKFGNTKAYKKYLDFVKSEKKVDAEKVEFINKFKRGGISHSNQPGKHNHALISYDIASQYPASMMYMNIPCGESKWTETYNQMTHGFYHLKNLVFDCKHKFKPIASKNDKDVLVWDNDGIDEVYLDSFMIKYLKEHYGLKSFDVVKGLVSMSYIQGKEIFGDYVDTLYNEKKLQDKYKSDNDERYNPALRECIKLFLNSLSGKLVEDPSRYFKLKYVNEDQKLKLNGIDAVKVEDEDKYNIWVNAGVMVYSYSKRLLFEYVRCLPNNSDDVIHIETDSIYFNKKHQHAFVENVKKYVSPKLNHYPIKIGADLGNVKVEKDTTDVSYFLGKKFYCIGDLYKIKGIPLKTIDEYGNDVELVNTELYESIYNGKSVVKEFYTMKKALFAENTYISSHKMSRTVKPCMEYKEWN